VTAARESSSIAWIESLSPWPTDGFGLGRMHALLDRLGHPERAFPAIHVVGTNGKSTATRTIAALLRAEGLRVGAYTSPHVSGWAERLDTDAETFERALARIRPDAEAVGATQFEALTAAALAQFAADRVDVAVVEAGLGGRLDATNVLDTRVVLLTNVGLEHTDVLGSTRDEIVREKLAVARPGATVVLGEPEWAYLVPDNEIVPGGAREAAGAFLQRPVEHDVHVVLPGRLERRGDEIRDGAHTAEAVDWLLQRLPRLGEYVICASILADKDVDGMLDRLARAGAAFVATASSNARGLPAAELARRAKPRFGRVETIPEPGAALARARELARPDRRPVLVTGSLYLLADLNSTP
jgi:dihydrofolate synthase / folylpolyglutamate synthase